MTDVEQAVTTDEATLLREKSELEASMKPITAPAVLFSLGGALLITGGVLWSVYWTDYHESGGEIAGASLMGVGGILVIAGAPWLGVRLGRNKSKQRRIEAIDRQLAIAPIFSPGAVDSRYGLQLGGTF